MPVRRHSPTPIRRHDTVIHPAPPLTPRIIAQRPHLAAEPGTSFMTDDLLDAQDQWLAHIAAGRIAVR